VFGALSDVSSILQVLGRQSTDGHDSDHRGPAVVAYRSVSWNRGGDGWSDQLVCSTLQVVVQQSADWHDSEHRWPAFVGSAAVSWNRRDDGDVFALV
jgi:hypothetical protein